MVGLNNDVNNNEVIDIEELRRRIGELEQVVSDIYTRYYRAQRELRGSQFGVRRGRRIPIPPPTVSPAESELWRLKGILRQVMNNVA